MRADELVDPELPVCAGFEDVLQARLPAPHLREWLQLLRWLGLKDSLPADCVLLCAKKLDAAAAAAAEGDEPSEDEQRMSFALMDAFALRLRKEITRRQLSSGSSDRPALRGPSQRCTHLPH